MSARTTAGAVMVPSPDRDGWNPGPPFVRIPSEAFDMIERNVAGDCMPTAIAAYVGLVRMADRHQCATFQLPTNYLAKVAGLSRRSFERRLEDLTRAGVVTVERTHQPGTKGFGFNRYHLAPLSRKVASSSQHLASGSGPQADAHPTDIQKGRREPASHKPIGTGERIGLENQRTMLQSELERLKAELPFVSGDERTRVCSDITSTKAQLADIERRLMQ